MLEIKLSASDNNWRLWTTRKADPAFQTFQKKALERDHYTCQYCGFVSTCHLEVVNRDNNYQNNRLGNMATACPLCAQCFFLESIGGKEQSAGQLIYLPEMPQNQLNALCHVIFSAHTFATHGLSQAKNVYRSLRLRSQPIEKQLGEGMSEPALLGRLLIEVQEGATQPEKRAAAQEMMRPIRLLPALSHFINLSHDWAIQAIRGLE